MGGGWNGREEALWRTVRTGSGQVSVFAKENCSGRVHREARGPSLVGGEEDEGNRIISDQPQSISLFSFQSLSIPATPPKPLNVELTRSREIFCREWTR